MQNYNKFIKFDSSTGVSTFRAPSSLDTGKEVTPLDRLKALLVLARDACTLLDAGTLSAQDIQHSLDKTGVCVIRVGPENTARIRQEVGALVAATFPKLSPESCAALRTGNFTPASHEWTKKQVSETEMALRSYRMPAPIPLKADRQKAFTDPTLNTVHLLNPLLANASLCVWENLAAINYALHPSNWFKTPERMICSEDGIKFADSVTYDPTKIHYDGQSADRVQIMFTTDTGPVRLFAVPGSGSPEAQALISQILGIHILGGFNTHKAAWDLHLEVHALMHSFGVAVPANGLLMWRTRVWHFEAEVTEGPAPVGSGRVALAKMPFDWNAAREKTKNSNVFRIYCGVVALPETLRDQLIRHAFFREHNWPMEPFAHPNRKTPVFVAEKSSQAAERGTYDDLELTWNRLKATPFADMKAYLRKNCTIARLRLHGLTPQDLSE